MTPNILPKLWQNGLSKTKSRYLECPSQRPDLNPIENVWAELERPTNLTQLHQFCQEELAKIHPTYCGKLVKHLTQVKQFKGNATKY